MKRKANSGRAAGLGSWLVVIGSLHGFMTAPCADEGGILAPPIDVARYAWEFPVVSNIAGADDLVQELQEEVQAILEAGHLAPLNCRYGDLMPSPAESHFVYQEPGRIVTTLAWAYPHLDAAQQKDVRRYVAAELEDPRFAPWGDPPMPRDVGARREWHPMDRVWGADVKLGVNHPSLHTLYGLWLYAFRSDDWELVRTRWPEVRAAYARRASQGNLYGTMGAHIALARLAERFNDTETRATAFKRAWTSRPSRRSVAPITIVSTTPGEAPAATPCIMARCSSTCRRRSDAISANTFERLCSAAMKKENSDSPSGGWCRRPTSAAGPVTKVSGSRRKPSA